MELNLLGEKKGNNPHRVALLPPLYVPSVPSTSNEQEICPICISNANNMAFGCGHKTCCDCGQNLPLCPICRRNIEIRIKLY